jgi:hypothetical protein
LSKKEMPSGPAPLKKKVPQNGHFSLFSDKIIPVILFTKPFMKHPTSYTTNDYTNEESNHLLPHSQSPTFSGAFVQTSPDFFNRVHPGSPIGVGVTNRPVTPRIIDDQVIGLGLADCNDNVARLGEFPG